MTTYEPVILVDIMKAVTDSMSMPINFQPGSSIQIIKSLNDLDNSITFKDSKYTLIAMVMPLTEKRDSSALYYAKVRIDRIVIATLTNSTDDVYRSEEHT